MQWGHHQYLTVGHKPRHNIHAYLPRHKNKCRPFFTNTKIHEIAHCDTKFTTRSMQKRCVNNVLRDNFDFLNKVLHLRVSSPLIQHSSTFAFSSVTDKSSHCAWYHYLQASHCMQSVSQFWRKEPHGQNADL